MIQKVNEIFYELALSSKLVRLGHSFRFSLVFFFLPPFGHNLL